MRATIRNQTDTDRHGSILLLTLVVVAGLALSSLAFTQTLILELEATRSVVRQIELRNLADSGIEAVAAKLETRRSADRSINRSPERLLRNIAVTEVGEHAGRFTISPQFPPNDHGSHLPWSDESAKLNLNTLPLDAASRKETRERLTALPKMTPAIADAILDWMDPDDEPSEFGAETSWYTRQNPPTRPRNGRLESLDELLQIRGVTAELLYGKHSDKAKLPVSGKTSNSGWSQFLSIRGAESNLRPDGQLKINVNQKDLVALYDALESEFDEEVARFIVAWRLAGTTTGIESRREKGKKSQAEIRSAAQERLNRQLKAAQGDFNGSAMSGPRVTRGGLDLSRRPAYRIRSIYDLLDVKVRIDVDRRDTLLKSPWKADSAFLEGQLPDIESRLGFSEQGRMQGRINVNLAQREVLLTVPGIDESLARRIVAARSQGNMSSQVATDRATISWLLSESIVDLAKLRTLAPYLTGRGDVVSGYAIGHVDGSDRVAVVEFVIDGTGQIAHVIGRRDLPPIRLSMD